MQDQLHISVFSSSLSFYGYRIPMGSKRYVIVVWDGVHFTSALFWRIHFHGCQQTFKDFKVPEVNCLSKNTGLSKLNLQVITPQILPLSNLFESRLNVPQLFLWCWDKICNLDLFVIFILKYWIIYF